MNQEQRAALRKLAEEATPGPWHVFDRSVCEGYTKYFGVDSEQDSIVLWDEFGGVIARQDAAHIAAANPSTILQLLDYIETLEKDAAQQRTAEACAKVCEAGRSEDGDGQHPAWYAGFDMCIDTIRNEEWREYL